LDALIHGTLPAWANGDGDGYGDGYGDGSGDGDGYGYGYGYGDGSGSGDGSGTDIVGGVLREAQNTHGWTSPALR
jgi:hypothetical protein